MNHDNKIELEAAAFRRLLAHLQKHPTVQNIDLMILAGFCRNCLAKWLTEEATIQNLPLNYAQAREKVYGMPYQEWKTQFQVEATAQQLEDYERKQGITQ